MRKWQLCVVAALAGARLIAQEVVERGPHHNILERIDAVGINGTNSFTTNRFTVLQPGLNFFSETEQQWSPTTTEIDLGEIGASYTKGPFRLDFSPNGGDVAGQVKLTLADGGILRIRTMGVALTDANGDSVWLGEIRGSGGLRSGNSIIYPDTFNGVKADVVVTISVGRYESDVVIREAIQPQMYGFDPATTRLEIWHQILQMPNANSRLGKIARQDGSVDID